MKIICLFIQRKNIYEGENAPELYAAVDEYTEDENPRYLEDQEDKAKKQSDIDFTRRIIIDIDDKEFDEVFFGKELNGKIVKED